MFREIPGLNVFSPGAYIEPEKGCSLRPALDLTYPSEWLKAWHTITTPDDSTDHKSCLTPESVEPFDIIVIQHSWHFLFSNIEVLRGKVVVWRDIGQVFEEDERGHIRKAMDMGIKIVRYWDGYQSRVNYAGHDAIIPFSKSPSDFKKWKGNDHSVMALVQSMEARNEATNYPFWSSATRSCRKVVYGNDNKGVDCYGGKPDYESMTQKMSEHRLFWYGGTNPAPYTLGFMEAMFAGIPIVSIKDPGWVDWGIPSWLPDSQLSSNPKEMETLIQDLLSSSDSFLNSVSKSQRSIADKMWSIEAVKPKWEQFLNSL